MLAIDRADVDHLGQIARAGGGLQQRRQFLGEEEDGFYVYVHHLVPAGFREFVETGPPRGAGVVEQDVHLGRDGGDGGGKPLDLRHLAEIGRDGGAGRAELGGKAFAVADLAAGDDNMRAILDLPLGDPSMVAPYAVMGNILGGDKTDMFRPYLHLMARNPDLKFHQYKKEIRKGRKVGHVTVVGENLLELTEVIAHARDYMSGEIDE